MDILPETYKTVWFTNDVLFGVHWRGKLHFFDLPILEVVHDTVKDRYELLCVDMWPKGPRERFPLKNPADDFSYLTGLELPEELREIA